MQTELISAESLSRPTHTQICCCFRYFEAVFNASGGPELVQKYGSWFSFSQSPRAQIFRRNQTLVTDIESMVRLMRYGLQEHF